MGKRNVLMTRGGKIMPLQSGDLTAITETTGRNLHAREQELENALSEAMQEIDRLNAKLSTAVDDVAASEAAIKALEVVLEAKDKRIQQLTELFEKATKPVAETTKPRPAAKKAVPKKTPNKTAKKATPKKTTKK